MTHTIKHDEFFKFYFVYTIIWTLYSTLLTVVPALLPEPPAASSTVMVVTGGLAVVMGLVGLVVTILAIVFIVKRQYAKVYLWLPISYFALGVIGAVVGVIVSLTSLTGQFVTMGPEADPVAVQAVIDDFSANPPLAITVFTMVRGLILFGLSIGLLVKSQRESDVKVDTKVDSKKV